MTKASAFKIKEVADIVGISVRTLHYYDEIKLLTPSDRSAAGYRLYDQQDLLRLQQILIGRKLGLALEKIRKALDDPEFDYEASLREQREQLVQRVDETHKMIAAIDKTLDELKGGDLPINFRAIFDGFDPADFEDEVAGRWGDTEAFSQSSERTRHYTETDWKTIKAEADAIWVSAADAMRAGVLPSSQTAAETVERYRLHVCRWFYDLNPAMYVQLSEMWTNDARFSRNIDKYDEGLTEWLSAAIKASSEAG